MMNASQSLPIGKRLTFRILLTTLIGLALTLAAIAYTVLLSWQLEGSGAAINEAGSLRMRSYRLAIELEQSIGKPQAVSRVAQSLAEYDRTLADLQAGDAKRHRENG